MMDEEGTQLVIQMNPEGKVHVITLQGCWSNSDAELRSTRGGWE
jgi:hypothetical protein